MSEYSDRDELLMRLSLDLAKLVDDGICRLTVAEQDLITTAMKTGSHLMMLVVMNPTPVYICSLIHDADSDPIEIFRVKLTSEAMTLLRSDGQMATAH